MASDGPWWGPQRVLVAPVTRPEWLLGPAAWTAWWAARGVLHWRGEGQAGVVGPGEMVVVQPRTWMALDPAAAGGVWRLQWFEQGLRPTAPGVLAVPLPPGGESLLGELNTSRDDGPHLGAAFLHLLWSRHPEWRREALPEDLARLLQEVEQNPGADHANPILARRLGRSVGGFIRWFRAEVGRSPAAWVSARRVEAAARRLLLTNEGIGAVATALGFPNRFYFTRVFRDRFAMGPATYRRQHQTQLATHTVLG